MKVLTILLGNEKFAIDITLVDAIENIIPLSPVPKAKDYPKGLINIRGSVLPLLNIRMLLLMNKGSEDTIKIEKLVIANLESGKMALGVSDVDDVLTVENDKIEIISSAENICIINTGTEIINLLTNEYLLNIIE